MNDTNDRIIRQISVISFGLIFITFFLVMANQPDELEWDEPVRKETTEEFIGRYVTDITKLGEAFDSCGFNNLDFSATYSFKRDLFVFWGIDSVSRVSGLERLLYNGKDKYGLDVLAHHKDENFYRLIMSNEAHFVVLVMFRNNVIPKMDFINDSTAMDLSIPAEVRIAALKEHGVVHVSGRVWADM